MNSEVSRKIEKLASTLMFYNSSDDLGPSAILDPPFCFFFFLCIHFYSKLIEIKVTVIEKLICV